jgi:hypothetical protein
MIPTHEIATASAFLSGLVAGDQAGILGWGWLLISLGTIFIVAILLIVAASWSDKSPYLENMAHGGGHAGGGAVAERHIEIESPVVPSVQADDLVIIEGIGPKINQILNDAGITTFAQLAETETSRLSEILLAAGLRISDPATWPDQARLAAQAKWQELEELKASLKGGRRA